MSTHPVQAVTRSLQLLEALADTSGTTDGELGVIALARRTGLSAGTAHRLLATLSGEGYVTHDDGTSRYRLGPRLFALAAAAESEITVLRNRSMPTMEALRDQFGETVNLAVLDRRHIIYVDQAESHRPVRAFSRTGNRVLAHASAAGKVLLAFEPTAMFEGLGEHPLESLTEATITSLDELKEHLREIRVRGYALDLGEQDEEVVCVAAPVGQPGRRPAGAISISGPSSRMHNADLHSIGAEVAAAATTVL
jgi:DNA-binding IclR family transcriptional regulator